MIHKIEKTRKLLRLLYNAMFMTLVLIFISVVFLKVHPPVYVYPIVIVGYICSYIVRDYAPSDLWILIIHLIMCGIIVPIKLHTGLKVLLIILIAHLIGESFLYSRNGSKLKALDDMPWPTFLISIIIYAYGFFMKESIMTRGAYFIPVVLLVIYYLMVYVEGLKNYVNATRDVAGLPLKKIISTNTMIVLMIVNFLVLGIILGNVLGLEGALLSATKGVIAFLKLISVVFITVWRIIASFFSYGGGNTSPAVIVEDKVTREYAEEIGASFELVLKSGVVLIAIYIVYKITIKIIKRLVIRRKFSTDIVETAEVSYQNTNTRIKRKIFKNIKLTPEEKIRKYYRLKVLRYKHYVNLTKQKTVEEIRLEIKEKELDDIDEMSQLYSDIRYGKTYPEKDMVKKMNRLTKQ